MNIIVTLRLLQNLTPEQLLFSLLPASAEGWGELPLCAGAKQTLNFTWQHKMPRLLSSSDNWFNVLELVPHLFLCFYNEFPDSLSLRDILWEWMMQEEVCLWGQEKVLRYSMVYLCRLVQTPNPSHLSYWKSPWNHLLSTSTRNFPTLMSETAR